ncbi:hypothetical protein [Haladaptatus sp. DYF46]|uniref:hypothetical protein n=1 Tax=Haladaptatus sp. DYF46 TaxID=2886041 RepID=UPI001E4C2444|nr:hypothetical protein [Haladaptatus sp. DYF46]
MSSETNALLRSIRRWLLILVFLFGVALVVLAIVGDDVTGYSNGFVFGIAGFLGGGISLVAGLMAFFDLIAEQESADTRNE